MTGRKLAGDIYRCCFATQFAYEVFDVVFFSEVLAARCIGCFSALTGNSMSLIPFVFAGFGVMFHRFRAMYDCMGYWSTSQDADDNWFSSVGVTGVREEFPGMRAPISVPAYVVEFMVLGGIPPVFVFVEAIECVLVLRSANIIRLAQVRYVRH